VKYSALAAVLAWELCPCAALAFEHQHQLGIDGGVAFISIDQKPNLSVGGGGGIHYSYGLTDAFNLLIEGAFCPVSLQELPDPSGKMLNNRPTMIENLGVGIAYTLDVVRWVPYIGILASGFTLHGGTVDLAVTAGATIAAGFDYQLTRGPKHLAIGIAVRQHFMLSDIVNYPSYTQIFLRAEYVWGY
jgi:hypothetical protein